MLCDVCQTVSLEKLYEGGYFPLHSSWDGFVSSAQARCCICKWITNDVDVTNRLDQINGLAEYSFWFRTYPKLPNNVTLLLSSTGDFSDMIEITSYDVYQIQNSISLEQSHFLPDCPISKYATSERCLEFARACIAKCLRSHTGSCPSKGAAELPTRVLDLGDLDSISHDSLSLRNTKGESGSWVVLSHCWGISPKSHYSTTTINIGERLHGIRFKTLPQTFQDAVTVTRLLGYRFLWIDSLCIMQDNEADWVKESSKMHHYYKNAALSIAADDSTGMEDGFLAPRTVFQISDDLIDITPCHSHFNIRHPVHTASFNWDSPLSKRAWVLQEDLLSSRTLHYTRESLVFECQASINFESLGGDVLEAPHAWPASLKSIFVVLRTPSLDSAHGKQPKNFEASWRFSWYSVVENYFRRGLTVESDGLPALSALAREVQNISGNTYASGIWIEDIWNGLLWQTGGTGIATTHYRAPSWSWASQAFMGGIPHAIFHRMFDYPLKWLSVESLTNTRKPKLIEWKITTIDEDRFGRLESGHLRIQGFSIKASHLQSSITSSFNHQRCLHNPDRIMFSTSIHEASRVSFSFDSLPMDMLGRQGLYSSEDKLNFSELDIELEHSYLLDIILLQVITITSVAREVSYALLLRMNEDGNTYKRVGIAEVVNVDGFAEQGWEEKEFTII